MNEWRVPSPCIQRREVKEEEQEILTGVLYSKLENGWEIMFIRL